MQQVICVAQPFCYLQGPPAQTDPDADPGGGTGGSGIVGSGSPEGVVTAEPGTIYFDSTGDSLWVKETGSGNTGWQQLIA